MLVLEDIQNIVEKLHPSIVEDHCVDTVDNLYNYLMRYDMNHILVFHIHHDTQLDLDTNTYREDMLARGIDNHLYGNIVWVLGQNTHEGFCGVVRRKDNRWNRNVYNTIFLHLFDIVDQIKHHMDIEALDCFLLKTLNSLKKVLDMELDDYCIDQVYTFYYYPRN
jgi:hypothetical protein